MRDLKVAVTGSNGLLGQKLIKLLKNKEGVEVIGIARGENRLADKEGYIYRSVDLTDFDLTRKTIIEIDPDFLIHTAAMTNVDACELNKEECDLLNVDVVANLVSVCRFTSTHLVHLSTDFVFSGLKGSRYTEADPPDPVNHYGWSKLRSEQLIEESGIPYAILRTVLVYGQVDSKDRGNVVLWVRDSLQSGKDIRVVTDQLRMPTYAEDLAEACWLAIENDATGIFNVSSSELMSIYEIALEVAGVFDLDKSLITPVETRALELPAQRPVATEFDLRRSAEVLGLPLRSFRDRLKVFKAQLDYWE